MNSFTNFCESIAMVKGKDSVDKTGTYSDEKFDLFVKNMKSQCSRFDKISMSYIQTALAAPGSIIDKVSSKYPDGDIPDELINALTMGLYGKAYADASETECKIINVLAIYYTISNN